MGLAGSLTLAFGAMTVSHPTIAPWSIFFVTILSGMFYGLVIDFVATKWGGEGKMLMSYK